MSDMLKKYEISVWEDELITLNNGDSYYKERKIAVIGSDSMTARNRVFSPILTINVNGEKTLTFSLKHRYFDDRVGDFVDNPIQKWLVNERKVKLFYNDEWYDFIIKECNESSEEEVFDYVAKDIFVNELSKQGYNITFNQELNNNMGTVIELGEETIKNTDWVIDKENCDLLQQTVDEPLYSCTTARSFKAINVTTNKEVTINANETIYVFYNYVANQDGTYLQFLRNIDRNNWSYDDNDIITGTNYRYNGTLTYKDKDDDEQEISPHQFVIKGKNSDSDISIINIGGFYTKHKGYRLAYYPRTIYDSVMGQEVELYKANLTNETQEIYKATTISHSTSTLVTSYVSNGTDFETDDKKKTISGWDNVVYVSNGNTGFNDLSLATYPPIKTTEPLVDLNKINSLSSYLEVDFKNTLNTTGGNYKNAIFNSGIMDNGATIGSISKGEEYAFRIRVGAAEKGKKPVNLNLAGKSNSQLPIKGYIAFYKTVNQTINGNKYSVKTFSANDIIFNFNTQFEEAPKVITGGTFDSDQRQQYIIDNVVQTPSLKYYYREDGDSTNYVWNPDKRMFQPVSNSSWFLRYYMNTAKAKQTVTSKKLQDPLVRIGIFLFTNDKSTFSNKCLYIEDVEIFKCLRDDKKQVILPGNVPTSASVKKETYYLKPKPGSNSSLINTYSTKSAIASDLYISEDDIVQVYNNNCEKVLSIEESQSNCFNILQTLCETFECWLKLTVEHEENGAIKLDENYKPIKKISFKKYVGKENYAGFKYGINLNSIERTIDSNEIVTKLIVAENQSDYVEDGMLTIAKAKSNPLKRPVIYNLDYYVQKGLISDKDAYLKDLNSLYSNVKKLDIERNDLENKYSKAQIALVNAKAQAAVYVEAEEAANTAYAEALQDFKKETKYSYQDYQKYLKENSKDIPETVIDTIGKIYSAASLLNNVGGTKTAAEQEYQRLLLDCEGAKEYSIVVSTTKGVEDYEESDNYTSARTRISIDDYLTGFKFLLKRTINGESEIEEYETDLNTKEFDIDNDVNKVPFDTLIIKTLPKNYLLRYTSLVDNKVHTTSKGGTFTIYDKENDTELTRRFKLIPTAQYAAEHKGYKKQIDDLIKQEDKYINKFEAKYRQYIQEGTWTDDSYIDSNLYYFDALQVSKTSAFPQISYTINVAEVSEIEGRENYNFEIGDKTYVEDVEFFGCTPSTVEIDGETIVIQTPIKEEVILSEIEWHLDDPSENTITVQNYKTQFEDLFQRISAAVQTVEYNAASYSRAIGILNENGEIDKDLLIKSMAGMAGNGGYPLTASSTIRITDDGVLANNLTNPKNYVKLSGSGISASSDGGHTWTDIVTADGISTKALTAGSIDTQLISIMDGNNTSFRWDKSGLSSYGFDENDGYDLTSFVRMDKYGLYGIKNGDEYIVSSLEDLKDKAHFSLTWDGFRIKNTYGNGYVDISSENDFRVVKVIPAENPVSTRALLRASNDTEVTKIHIGAIEKDSEGTPTLYGIRINNDNGDPVMETDDNGDLSVTGNINATSGNFTGRVYVGDYNDKYILLDSQYGQDSVIASSDYIENTTAGWAINGSGDAIFNNVSVRGAIKTAVFEYSEIEAVGGAFLFRPSSSIKEARIKEDYKLTEDTEVDYDKNYYELIDNEYVEVGNGDESEDISGKVPVDEGWYEENFSDIIIVTENNQLFRQNEWVKLSNCNSHDATLINDGGLTHVYKISNVPSAENCIILIDAAKDFPISISQGDEYRLVESPEAGDNPSEKGWYEQNYYYGEISADSSEANPSALEWYEYDETSGTYIATEDTEINSEKTYYKYTYRYVLSEDTIVNNKDYYEFIPEEQRYILRDLEGGALISFGYHDNDSDYDEGAHNYGIGINSSDNYVGLPERAISLFETKIHPDRSVKVTYDYKGILGTLPPLGNNLVNQSVYNNMAGTQGIFTNNMYIGDNNQYLAFYTDQNGKKHLKISAKEMIFEVNEQTGEETTWDEHIDEQIPVKVEIDSSAGNMFIHRNLSTRLTCKVYKGTEDITSTVRTFNWQKKDKNGNIDESWVPPLGTREILNITSNDVESKAIFICTVQF